MPPKPETTPPSISAQPTGAARLLANPVAVINVGLPNFAADLRMLGVAVVHVDWVPPAGGDPELGRLLAKLGS